MQYCFDLAVNEYFEIIILSAVLLNTSVMCIKWLGMTEDADHITEIVNYVFTGVFVCEAALKLMAFQHRYFKDRWN